jgi:hypothetical protein
VAVKKRNPARAWDVFLRGKKIDTVHHFDVVAPAWYVKQQLVSDGYDPKITVKRARTREENPTASFPKGKFVKVQAVRVNRDGTITVKK